MATNTDIDDAVILDGFRNFYNAYSKPLMRGDILSKLIKLQIAFKRPVTNYRVDWYDETVNKIVALLNTTIEEFNAKYEGKDKCSQKDIEDLLLLVGLRY
jgi:hypothetical protein